MGNPESLTPGYAHLRRGTAAYRGVLRRPAGSVAWTCSCRVAHLTAVTARACAGGELDRRRQAAGVVITLLHCGPCSRWWDDGAAPSGCPVCGVPLLHCGPCSRWWDDGAAPSGCPVCGVPLERLKLVVTGRAPAVDGGNRHY